MSNGKIYNTFGTPIDPNQFLKKFNSINFNGVLHISYLKEKTLSETEYASRWKETQEKREKVREALIRKLNGS